MNKLIMVLAFLLMPFFSSFFTYSQEIVAPESVVSGYDYQCKNDNGTFLGTVFVSGEFNIENAMNACHELQMANVISRYEGAMCSLHNPFWNTYSQIQGTQRYGSSCQFGPATKNFNMQGGSYEAATEVVCPSTHIYGIDDDNDGVYDTCALDNPNLEQCPQGNYKYKLAGGCVPIECGSSGQQKTMWSSGSVYTNTAGTYCDGSCAFSVSGGQNADNYEGNIGITGVSTGDICGQGHPDDRWHNEGNGDDCVSQDGFLSCPNGDTPDAPTENQPTIDLEPEKVTLEEITPLIPTEETCTSGDASCEIRNLKETILTKGLEQKEIDKILHNKKITADEKSSTKIIDGLKESAGRNAQGLQMVTAAIDGLKGSIGGGGGSSNGDGFGDGDVTCVDDDCEGGIETDIEPSEGLVGYWESEYEDGLEGMFTGKIDEFKTTEFFLFLDQFKPQISGGSAPDYNWCFNFGQYMNLGCHNLSIDPRVFPALKIFILISAAFACRAILFGG